MDSCQKKKPKLRLALIVLWCFRLKCLKVIGLEKTNVSQNQTDCQKSLAYQNGISSVDPENWTKAQPLPCSAWRCSITLWDNTGAYFMNI